MATKAATKATEAVANTAANTAASTCRGSATPRRMNRMDRVWDLFFALYKIVAFENVIIYSCSHCNLVVSFKICVFA